MKPVTNEQYLIEYIKTQLGNARWITSQLQEMELGRIDPVTNRRSAVVLLEQVRNELDRAVQLAEKAKALKDSCQCVDLKCPVHGTVTCGNKAYGTLFSVNDHEGIRFCERCYAHALETGLFSTQVVQP